MAQYQPGPSGYRLSDGKSFVTARPGEDEAAARLRGETQMANDYGALAGRQNAPVTAGDYIYSATNRYPNTVVGSAMAHLDHWVPGALTAERALGSAGLNAPVGNPGGGMSGMLARVGTGGAAYGVAPPAALYDVGAAGYNAAKQYLAPSLAGRYEAPSFYGTIAKEFGTPPADPNANPAQRWLENVATTATQPGGWVRNLARGTGATVGGELGGSAAEHYLGPNAQPLGQVLGSLAGGTGLPTKTAQAGTRWLIGGEQAPQTQADFASTGIPGSIGPLASMTGRRMLKSGMSLPWLGSQLAGPAARTAEGIQNLRDQIAEGRAQAGGGSLTQGVGVDNIGRDVVEGARQGAANLTHRAEDLQQQALAAAGPDAPTNLGNVIDQIDARSPRLDTTTQNAVEPTRQLLAQDINRAQTPEVQNAYYRFFNPGEVPLEVAQQARSNLGRTLPNQPALPGRQKDFIYGDITDEMRNTFGPNAPLFDQANEVYRTNVGTLRPQLEDIGGKPSARGGYDSLRDPATGGTQSIIGHSYDDSGKSYLEAYNWLNQNMRSPDVLANFYNPRIVPQQFSAGATGKYLATLGNTKWGSFRPDYFASAWLDPKNGISPETKDLMFGTPGGGTHPDVEQMNAAARIAQNATVPPESSGLTSQVGAGYGVYKGGEMAGEAGQAVAEAAGVPGWIGKLVGVGAGGLGVGHFLNAPSTLAAVGGQPSWTIAEQLYRYAPYAAAEAQMQSRQPQTGNPLSFFDPSVYALPQTPQQPDQQAQTPPGQQ